MSANISATRSPGFAQSARSAFDAGLPKRQPRQRVRGAAQDSLFRPEKPGSLAARVRDLRREGGNWNWYPQGPRT